MNYFLGGIVEISDGALAITIMNVMSNRLRFKTKSVYASLLTNILLKILTLCEILNLSILNKNFNSLNKLIEIVKEVDLERSMLSK